jgi:hypothetical protein
LRLAGDWHLSSGDGERGWNFVGDALRRFGAEVAAVAVGANVVVAAAPLGKETRV